MALALAVGQVQIWKDGNTVHIGWGSSGANCICALYQAGPSGHRIHWQDFEQQIAAMSPNPASGQHIQ